MIGLVVSEGVVMRCVIEKGFVGAVKGSLGGCPDEAFQRNVELLVKAADHFQG